MDKAPAFAYSTRKSVQTFNNPDNLLLQYDPHFVQTLISGQARAKRFNDTTSCIEYALVFYALPAGPIWVISLVLSSSFRSVDQLAISSLIRFSSTLVPITFAVDMAISIGAKSGKVALYRFMSAVGRSKTISVGVAKSILARCLSTFLRYKVAMTVVGVW